MIATSKASDATSSASAQWAAERSRGAAVQGAPRARPQHTPDAATARRDRQTRCNRARPPVSGRWRCGAEDLVHALDRHEEQALGTPADVRCRSLLGVLLLPLAGGG